MRNIIGTGLSGLVGSRVVELLQNTYDFEDISRKTATDITDPSAVLSRLQNSSAEWVIHMAAYTNVDGAEQQKDLKEESEAWKINVLGTENVVKAAEATNKKLIYISTDMVFPGTKPLPEKYNEEDPTGAVGWYGQTKEKAEQIVKKAKIPWTIIRIAYPYHVNQEKGGYVLVFKSLLEQGKEIKAVSDHFFTPLFIDDLGPILQFILQQSLTGVYHAGGEDSVSPYMVAQKVAEVFQLNKTLIQQTTREEFFKGKAPRAFNLSLSNAKIEKLGISTHGLEEGLRKIKQLI